MKIAYYATTILEHGGGLETYLIESSKNMSLFDDVIADVITMDDNFTNKIVKMLEIFYFKRINKKQIYKENLINIKKRLGNAKYYKIDTINNLKKKLNEYDIIYSKNELLEAFILKFLIGYNKLPSIIFGCHTPVYYPTTDSLQSKLHNFLYNSFVYKFLTSGAKAFHVTNIFDEKNLYKLFPNKKIVKIYNPLHIQKLKELSEKYICKFNWDKLKLNLLWVGRLTEQKGVFELLWIINYLNNTKYKNKIIFNIIGDGDNDLRHEIIDFKTKWGNINFFGYVQYKHLPSIYKNNNLFINTSKWESFGLSLLEAQAFGLPAISFNIPGSQDIIENKKTGFLVGNKNDYVNRIIEIINKKVVFNEKIIIKYVRNKFEEKKVYRNLKKLFKQVIDNKTKL